MTAVLWAVLAFSIGGVMGMLVMCLAAASRDHDMRRAIRALIEERDSQAESLLYLAAERDRLIRRLTDR